MEATKTRALLKRVRETYPAAFVYKVNDRTRSGIPDSVMCLDGEDVWVEFKELRIVGAPSPEQVRRAVTEIQRLTIHKMVATDMNVIVVVFVDRYHYLFRYDCFNRDFIPLTHSSFLSFLGELWR